MDHSWRRRRVVAAIMLCGGIFLLSMYDRAPGAMFRTGGLILAPATILTGLLGLIYPPTIIDPATKLEELDANPAELQRVAGNWPVWVGMGCWLVGIGIGIYLRIIW